MMGKNVNGLRIGDEVLVGDGPMVGIIVELYKSSKLGWHAEILLADGRMHAVLVERLVKIGEYIDKIT